MCAGFDFGEEGAALFVALLFDELAAGNDDVLAVEIDFQDLEVIRLADVLVEVLRRLDVDLRRRQKRVDAHRDDETAFDFRLDAAGTNRAFLAFGDDRFPVLLLLRLVVGNDGRAVAVFGFFEIDLDLVADLNFGDVGEFACGNDPFGFPADVDDDVVLTDFDDRALDDRARRERSEAAFGKQLFHYG